MPRRHGAPQALMPGRIQLWGHQIAVDWAEPEISVERRMSWDREDPLRAQPHDRDHEGHHQEELRPVQPGLRGRVKKIRDYAFVHFASPARAPCTHEQPQRHRAGGSMPRVAGQARRQGSTPATRRQPRVSAQQGSSGAAAQLRVFL